MPVINYATGRVTLLRKGEELLLGRGLTALSESLDIALARFDRQSRATRMASHGKSCAPSYECNPHLAVNDLTLILSEKHFGGDGELTFFEEFPSAAYFILEGRGRLFPAAYNFYRLGLICAAVNRSENIYLGIDPVYPQAVTRASLFLAETDDQLFNLLGEHYGGKWKADQVFHPESGRYEWLENRTVKSFFPKKKE